MFCILNAKKDLSMRVVSCSPLRRPSFTVSKKLQKVVSKKSGTVYISPDDRFIAAILGATHWEGIRGRDVMLQTVFAYSLVSAGL